MDSTQKFDLYVKTSERRLDTTAKDSNTLLVAIPEGKWHLAVSTLKVEAFGQGAIAMLETLESEGWLKTTPAKEGK